MCKRCEQRNGVVKQEAKHLFDGKDGVRHEKIFEFVCSKNQPNAYNMCPGKASLSHLNHSSTTQTHRRIGISATHVQPDFILMKLAGNHRFFQCCLKYTHYTYFSHKNDLSDSNQHIHNIIYINKKVILPFKCVFLTSDACEWVWSHRV